MRKYLALLCTICLTALLAACGGKSNASNNLIYDKPATLAPGDNNFKGGSLQGTALDLTAATAKVELWAGTLGTPGTPTAEETPPRLTAKFNQPTAITIGRTATVTADLEYYVADQKNGVIRVIDKDGNVSILKDKATGTNIAVGTPTDLAFSYDTRTPTAPVRYLYVVDSSNHVIRKINLDTLSSADIITFGSSGTSGAVDSLTDPTAARFKNPIGITSDGVNVYVADSGNNLIRWIDSEKAVRTLAGSGTSGSDDGVGSVARFNLPARITTDGTSLFVTDANNRTIRKIDIRSADVKTLAGIAGTTGTADTAPGVTATFRGPNGITTDGTNLYITDITTVTDQANPQYSHLVRQINIASATVTTIAGGVSSDRTQSTPGIGRDARFATPLGITTDGTALYVVESLSHSISKISKP